MRKWITLLMTLLVGCQSYTNANMGEASFEAGYRRDTIDWRQRFPSDQPFINSSIRFKDIDIFQIGVHGRSTLGNNFYVRGSAYWGWVLDGDFDRKFNAYFGNNDYFADDHFRLGFGDRNRTTVDDKYVFGIGAAIGYPFFFCDCTMLIAPTIGYSFDEQNLRVDDVGFDFNPYCLAGNNNKQCCRNTFISRWYGPFVGLDFDWRPWNSCFNLWAEVEYHWGNFRGKRSHGDNFNIFDDRNRTSHKATAWVFSSGIDYDFCNNWTVGIDVKFQNWAANRHHEFCRNDFDAVYNNVTCNNKTRTNHKWRSYAINLTLGKEF